MRCHLIGASRLPPVQSVQGPPQLCHSFPVAGCLPSAAHHLIDQTQSGLLGERPRRTSLQRRYRPSQAFEFVGFHSADCSRTCVRALDLQSRPLGPWFHFEGSTCGGVVQPSILLLPSTPRTRH
jgi:hypothetical protein